MREVDGRLSQRASHYWPRSLVVKEVRRPGVELPDDHFAEEQWWLERPDVEPVSLGAYYAAAVRALSALIKAEAPA